MSDDARELAAALDRFTDRADRLLSNSNGGSATIHVNAGGVGLWVVITAFCVMLAINLVLWLWVSRIDRENSEYGHQLNAIYMMAPQLKEDSKDGN